MSVVVRTHNLLMKYGKQKVGLRNIPVSKQALKRPGSAASCLVSVQLRCLGYLAFSTKQNLIHSFSSLAFSASSLPSSKGHLQLLLCHNNWKVIKSWDAVKSKDFCCKRWHWLPLWSSTGREGSLREVWRARWDFGTLSMNPVHFSKHNGTTTKSGFP